MSTATATGRNDACPCGSGKKFKKCHGEPPGIQVQTGKNILTPASREWRAFEASLVSNISFHRERVDREFAKIDRFFLSKHILSKMGYDAARTVQFLQHFGAHCDYEVLWNAKILFSRMLRETGFPPASITLADVLRYKTHANNSGRKIIFGHDVGLGDAVILTSVIRQMKKAHPGISVNVLSVKYSELFSFDPRLTNIRKAEPGAEMYLAHFHNLWDIIKSDTEHYARLLHNELMRLTGLTWDTSNIIPEFHLPKGALNPVRTVLNHQGPYWILSGNHSTEEKFWPYYPDLIRLLRGKVQFVQIGTGTDKAFEGALSLLGKTTIHEILTCFRDAAGVIGGPGFSGHIAAGFKKPCIVIAGAIEHPAFIGYDNQIVIDSINKVQCNCIDSSFQKKCTAWDGTATACMRAITPGQVAEAVLKYCG